MPAQVLNQIKDSDDYNTELTSTKFASSVFGKAEFRTFTMNNFDTRLVNAKFKVVALDSKNRELSKNDLQKLFKTTPDSITLKFTVSYTDKNKTEHSESNSYVFSNKDKGTETTPQGQVELAKSINANYTNPYNVAVGSKTLDAELSTSVDMKLTNQNGTAIKVSDIHVGDVHTTFAGALGQTFTREDDTYSKATFEEKGKTYYQSVQLSINNGDLGKTEDNKEQLIENIQTEYNKGTEGYVITVNGQAATANQYKVASAVAGSADTQASRAAGTPNTITLVREIKVGDKTSENDWKVEDVKDGIVVVGDKVAALYNDDNQFIENRSLAKDTAWQTNKKRTNAKGEVQYRVSTHEWVNAADVKLSQGSSTTDPETVFTDVQNLETPIVVSLAGPSSFNYYLYNSKGQMVTYRGLGGDSAWLVSKIAKDKDGNKMYRVSTDEWLMAGDGLTEVK